jgi:hypothetical protein
VSIVGPRVFGYRARAPVSLRQDEVEALLVYRRAYREYREAQRAERLAVSANLPKSRLDRAYERSTACADALSQALAALHAVCEAE